MLSILTKQTVYPAHSTYSVCFLFTLYNTLCSLSPSLSSSDSGFSPSLVGVGISLPPRFALFPRFKFLELYYRRQETTHKGKPVAARVETVVIYVPDVWNCVPTQLEWDGLTVNYKKMYTTRVSDKPEEGATKPADDDKANTYLSISLSLSVYHCLSRYVMCTSHVGGLFTCNCACLFPVCCFSSVFSVA